MNEVRVERMIQNYKECGELDSEIQLLWCWNSGQHQHITKIDLTNLQVPKSWYVIIMLNDCSQMPLKSPKNILQFDSVVSSYVIM